MIADEHLPRLSQTDWRNLLPLEQGEYLDGDGRRVKRFGYEVFGPRAAPAAAIWYVAEADTVVIHHNDRLDAALRARVEEAARVLRIQVARAG